MFRIVIALLLITTPVAAYERNERTEFMKMWWTLNEMCRGGSGNTIEDEQACELRTEVGNGLEREGWCMKGDFIRCRRR
jgi:hypothetical protein